MDGNMKKNAVENFISTLDKSLPREAHYKNAISDSFSYGWDLETLREIIDGIDKSYTKIKETKKGV